MNEKTKHTPGPWRWSSEFKTGDGRETWSLLSGDGYGILSCDAVQNSPQSLGIEGEANARLIAAAPELLEALEAIKRHWDSGNFSRIPELYEPMNAAIAKARGEKGGGV